MISLLRHLGSSSSKRSREERMNDEDASPSSYRGRNNNSVLFDEDMTVSVASPNLDEPGNALLTAMSSPLVEEEASSQRTTTVTFHGVGEPTTSAVAKRPASHAIPTTTGRHGVQGPTSTVATHGDDVNVNDNGTATTDTSLSPHDLWKMIDRELRTNMGNSVRCGICLCTLTNPIMTPCVHAYCNACLTTVLRLDRSPKCPECNQPITKRSCQPYPFMNDLAKVYKELLQDFGLTPSERDPTFTTLTQAVPSSEEEEERNDDDDDDDDDHPQSSKIQTKNSKNDTKQRQRLERSQVSKTWQLTLEQVVDVEPIFMAENAKVVAANERAVQLQQKQKASAGVLKPPSETLGSAVASFVVGAGPAKTSGGATMAALMTPGQASRRPPHPPSSMTQPRRRSATATTTKTSTAASIAARRLYSSTPSPAGSAFPNTQDIIEQAQEQQAADRSAEWLEEDDDDELKEQPRSPRNSTSFLFPQSAEENNNTNPCPPSPSPTFGTAREEEASQDTFAKLQQQQQSQVYGTPADLPSQTTMDVGEARLSVREPQDEKINNEEEEEEEDLDEKETPSSRDVKHCAKVSNQKGSLQTNTKRSSALLSSSSSARSSKHTDQQTVASLVSTVEGTTMEAPTPRTSSRSAKATTQSVVTVASKQPLSSAKEPRLEDHDSKPEAATGPYAPPRESSESATASESATNPIAVGTIVAVQPRTWPGVNKQGGVARITKVHGDGSSYNVSYILGGRESNVDAIFVRQDDNGKSQRRRVAAPAATITTTAPRAAAAFIEELPADLLATLAQEGFDTGARQAPKNKRKAQSAGGEQQEGTTKRASSLVSSLDVKRRKSTVAEPSSCTTSRRNSSSTSTTTTSPTTKSNRRRPFKDVANQNSVASKRTKTATGKKSTTAATTKRKSPKVVSIAAPTTATSDDSPKATATAVFSTKKQQVESKKPGTTATTTSGKGKQDSTKFVEEVVQDADDQLCGLADAHYAKYVETAIRDEKVVYVVASNLEVRDVDVLQALCRKTHGSHANEPVKFKLMDDFSSKTTLCITHVDESKNKIDTGNRCARIRSLKLMRSALAGIPIVTPCYVHTCHEKGAIIIPTPSMMIRSLPTKTRGLEATGSTGYGVASLAATMHQSTSSDGHHLLFSNMFVLLCGAFSAGKRADIHLLLKEGGAELLSNPAAAVAKLKTLSSSTTDEGSPHQNAVKVVLLCDDSSSTSSMNVIPAMLEKEAKTTLDSSHAESLLVVNSSWLFDSITCGRPLDARFFQPSAKKAKELWSQLISKSASM